MEEDPRRQVSWGKVVILLVRGRVAPASVVAGGMEEGDKHERSHGDTGRWDSDHVDLGESEEGKEGVRLTPRTDLGKSFFDIKSNLSANLTGKTFQLERYRLYNLHASHTFYCGNINVFHSVGLPGPYLTHCVQVPSITFV